MHGVYFPVGCVKWLPRSPGITFLVLLLRVSPDDNKDTEVHYGQLDMTSYWLVVNGSFFHLYKT